MMHIEAMDTLGKDAEAVAAVRGGNAERYRELVERHERHVFAVAWSRLGDAALAEDATQEAFIRGYRRLWLLGDDRKFAGWITAIARHIAINLGLRHRRELNRRERWALEQPVAQSAQPDTDEADTPCTPETLRQTLAELPATHRECLVLFYLEGRSGAEAAAALGISEAALRVRLHRARAALRERLEERLADSLGKLGPGKTLVPGIMAAVLALSSTKTATAAGGAAVLGTMVKVAPFTWLLPVFAAVVGALPGLAMTALAAKAEQRNFRDPTGFRAQMQRAMSRRILWVVPLVTIPLVLAILALISKLGQSRAYAILALFMVGIFALQWRMTGIRNRFQAGMLVWFAMLAGGIVLTAAGLVPPTANAYFFIAGSLWLMWIMRWRPTRMDNSLFLRAMMGMLEVPPPDAATAKPAAQLEKSDLKRFGKFLTDRHLFNDFRWCPEGLLLRQTFFKPTLPASKAVLLLFSSRDSSNVLLRWNGDVTATFSEADERAQITRKAEEAALRERLETQVAAAVTQAWREFRNGIIPAAERAVGEKPDAEIFVVPPARAASTRWLQAMLALPVVLFTAMIVLEHHPELLKPFVRHHSQAVSLSEAEVRATLAQLGEGGVTGSNAVRELGRSLPLLEVLPAKSLFASNAWAAMREHVLRNRFNAGENAVQRVDRLLGAPDLLCAGANGWLGLADCGLTREELRRSIRDAPEARRWFTPQEVPVVNHDGTTADYAALKTGQLARRVQCLQRFECLDAMDGSTAIEALLKHQVLFRQLPADARKAPFLKLLHGSFLTAGSDPIQNTYDALVVLESFGAVDRVDREACIRGLLRFHHGGGLFKSLQPDDGLSIRGDSRDTVWAFESLRRLGALDRVADLDQWTFRPRSVSKPATGSASRSLTWEEIEAWVCQQRLARILRAHQEHPAAPVRSLLDP